MIELLINMSVAYSNLKQNDNAQRCLRRALEVEPANAAANFNLGLLLAEGGKTDEAETALRAALKTNPQLAPAAYNLGVLLAGKKNMAEAILFCRKACELRPDEVKYVQTLALYLSQEGKSDAAKEVLQKSLDDEKLQPEVRKILEEELKAVE